jgi:thiamine kinase-like enzyme
VEAPMETTADDTAERVRRMGFWSGEPVVEPLTGGITNTNFKVTDAGTPYFVRVGEDLPTHLVQREQEKRATIAAHAAGLAPRLVHAEPGVLVLQFIDGRPLDEPDIRDPAMLERLMPLVRQCHHGIPQHLRGPALMFWVFHVVRHYAGLLEEYGSRYRDRLADLRARADELERVVGRIEVVFGHNDLLAANFIDDGERLWLIDYDYAGFNSPLFDLGGLASNAELPSELERRMLQAYYGEEPDTALNRRFEAMKCASLLRESMWSMTSELFSDLDFDFAAYTQENLDRLERAWSVYAAT